MQAIDWYSSNRHRYYFLGANVGMKNVIVTCALAALLLAGLKLHAILYAV